MLGGSQVLVLQVPLASSARALRDRGALSPLRSKHNAIELLFDEPLGGPNSPSAWLAASFVR